MDDLRAEIRAAFEREQAAHPPAMGLRPVVVRSAVSQPRQKNAFLKLPAVPPVTPRPIFPANFLPPNCKTVSAWGRRLT